MDDEANNPTNPGADTTAADEAKADAAMREAAAKADAGEATPAPEVKPVTEEKKETGGEAAKVEKPDANKPANASAEKKPETEKQPTKFEQAKQKEAAERARLDESWKKLNAEKEAVKREREQIDASRKSVPAVPDAGAVKEAEQQAAIHERLVKKYEAEGDAEMAAAAKAKAEEFRDKAGKLKTETAKVPEATPAVTAHEPWKTEQFKKEWAGHARTLKEEHPELADDNHPLLKRTDALIMHKEFGRFFIMHPDGARMAFEVAKLQEAAAQAKTLTEQIAAKDKEIAELNKKLGLSEAPASGASGGKRFEDMSDAEQDAEMRRRAIAADGG